MKQVLQNRKTGRPFVADVPVPVLQRGRVLVRTRSSLISAGTERAAIELAGKGLLREAGERPDLVKRVLTKATTEGFVKTFSAVRDKLTTSQALGYSASGVVIEVADDAPEFRVGDAVACAGLGFASHAEVLAVPRNLCVRLPESVDFDAGAFGTLGAIALQGVRLAQPTLGESVVVIGLGLVGQLTAQLLKANGCRVFGLDTNADRTKLALELGADAAALPGDEAKKKIQEWTRGRGADAVLVTSATDSNQPVEMAAQVSRLKGRVVVVGTTGLDIPRDAFYRRELSLTVSMSYGPGRYDPSYEEKGHDYPFGYVRWTEKRNIEAFLDLVAAGHINVESLISHRFRLDQAESAYQLITGEVGEPYLGVLLRYEPNKELARHITLRESLANVGAATLSVGLIGAGSYVSSILLPHFSTQHVDFHTIATASGVSAHDVGKRFGFRYAVSSAEDVLADENVNLVVIGTRHGMHASLATEALRRNKHVFVEKPLALNEQELAELINAAADSSGQLWVGFNRRLSPLAQQAKAVFNERTTPLSVLYRVNAGRVTKEHWTHDAVEGGGRIKAETCHFIDLLQYWIGAPPVSVFAECIDAKRSDVIDADSVFLTLHFNDGSIGCVAYLSEGDNRLAKERIEIFGDGKTFVIDDFKHGSRFHNGREKRISLRTQDKGQGDMVRTLCNSVREGKPSFFSLVELESATLATFRAVESLKTGHVMPIDVAV
ncbi:MAG: bi-domain-containing oxidoreductase [Pyrinomonadaceae bacterium]